MTKMKSWGLMASVALMFGASQSHAAIVQGDIGVLTRMWAHATYGGVNPPTTGGDVAFFGSASVGSCQGFWLRATDPGFKAMYAVVLAARATGRPVLVSAQNSDLWAGSSTPTCRIDAIDFAD